MTSGAEQMSYTEHMLHMVSKAVQILRPYRNNTAHPYTQGPSGPRPYSEGEVKVREWLHAYFQKHFPGFGVFAKDTSLRAACTLERLDAYFTVNPLDGYNTFLYGTPFGIGVNIALVINGQVVAVVIGDVIAEEMYFYGLETDTVLRAWEGGRVDLCNDGQIHVRRTLPLEKLMVMLPKSRERIVSPLLKALVAPHEFGGAFLDYRVMSGGPVMRATLLFGGMVGGCLFNGDEYSAWELVPITGIAERLGLAWLQSSRDGSRLERFDPKVTPRTQTFNEFLLVPHQKVAGLNAAVEALAL